MDDYEEDYSDYDDYDSGGDVFDEEDGYDDDEEEEEEEEEGEEVDEEEEEEENEEGDQEEGEDAGDEMEDYEEEEDELTEIGEQFEDEEEIVEDLGVEIEEEAVEYEEFVEEEEEEEELMEEEEEEEEELEEEEEEEEDELFEEEDEVYGEEGSYEDDGDYDNGIEIRARVPLNWPATSIRFLRFQNAATGFLDLSEDGGGIARSGSDRRRNESGDGTASSRPTADRQIGGGGSHDSSLAGIQGTNCPICFERWTGEGEHCVCCLPCGHLYGLSCIKMWLERPNSQKCPQCNDFCELVDVRRLYGLQLAISGVEELQQRVKCLEAKCASLELKDTDWLRKEAKWQKREADLQEQLNQHKEAKAELPKDIRERCDPADDPEPENALRHMKL